MRLSAPQIRNTRQRHGNGAAQPQQPDNQHQAAGKRGKLRNCGDADAHGGGEGADAAQGGRREVILTDSGGDGTCAEKQHRQRAAGQNPQGNVRPVAGLQQAPSVDAGGIQNGAQHKPQNTCGQNGVFQLIWFGADPHGQFLL